MTYNQNIVITGAAGFIGSTFANILSLNKFYNLTLIDSLEFGNIDNLSNELQDKLIITNCLDTEILRKIIPIDCTIFHFAGISSLAECESNYLKAINNNFLSTVNIFEIAIEKNLKKFIFASTSAVYENNKKIPFEENDIINPDLMYSYSKNLCENYLDFRSKKVDAPQIIITRFFNVFGYNQNIFRKNPPLTGYLIDCIQKNSEAIIYNNNSEIKRDYIFVNDLIAILISLIDINNLENYEIINLTSGNLYSVQDIIESIEKISNKKLKYKFENPTTIWSKYPTILEKITEKRISDEVYKSSIGDNSKLKEILPNDFKFTNMDEGVFLMINHINPI